MPPRASHAVLACLFAAVASLSLAGQAPRKPSGGPVSDAERRYVAPAATGRVASEPRRARVEGGYGKKFAAQSDAPNATISNPYLDPVRPLFAKVLDLQCAADGSLVVTGRAGFDPDGRALGTGFWRIQPDGAIVPIHTRSTNAYPVRPRATCSAPFAKSLASPEAFSIARDGRLLFSAGASLQAVGPDGMVARVAGSPRDCDNDNTHGISGLADGPADAARFREGQRPVEDDEGNLWVADQGGCALRRVTPAGQVTTVIPASTGCDETSPGENRLLLANLTWDAVHKELVSGGSLTVARPVHNLYTTIWRIKPTGEFRRVLFATKLGRSPARQNLDGVSALAVDPKGRIHVISLLMLFEQRGWDALQLLRIDEEKATVVPLTGTRIPRGAYMRDQPLDGPSAVAWFQQAHGMCFAPDGTLYVNDDILIRKVDVTGQVTTWAF